MSFTYFVILAEMRTGSNFLEASLSMAADITCHGEVFNPAFIGYPNRESLLDLDMAARERDPIGFLEAIQSQSDRLGGFRYFSDHDPRVLDHVLLDPKCAKIILTRNPLESYISLKIARETGQWKLGDAKQRRDAKVKFDAAEFQEKLNDRQAFQTRLRAALQQSGQVAFHLDYSEIADPKVLNGVLTFLGSAHQVDAAAKTTKKQNPAPMEEKVSNYKQMVQSLSQIDPFEVAKMSDFEPPRGPGVPRYLAAKNVPLLYIPVPGAHEDACAEWLTQLDGGTAPVTGFSQKSLRQWQLSQPGHRTFTIVDHPLARAHRVFCKYILPKADNPFKEPRRIMAKRYGMPLPTGKKEPYTLDMHRLAFEGFLTFLQANLARQTSVRIDPLWATQFATVQAAALATQLDLVIRADHSARDLGRIAEDFGLKAPAWRTQTGNEPFSLEDIYDGALEKQCFRVYRKDYINFGFGDWR